MRRTVAVVVLATAFAAVPAGASAAVPADSSGSLGGGMATFGDNAIDLGPIAPCAAGGPVTSSSPGVSSDDGLVSFGSGTTSCGFDPAGLATATASGKAFRLDALRQYGGPGIRIASYSASCTTTSDGGSQSSISLGGVSGVSIPSNLPTNHVVTIPGSTPADPPLAVLTFNSVVTPEPGDGSSTVSAVKIRFFPNGGPGSGTMTVGQVTCTPSTGD